MKIIADLHIHSRFSRATSKSINIQNLEKFARIKGVNLLGTADFTHPSWVKELKENLIEDGTGILRTKTGFPFIWQTEICLMYSQGGKGRRVHLVLLAPNKEVVDQVTAWLKTKGRVDYDGRPIFGFTAPEFVERLIEISKDIEIIPAHIWTSWFGLLGSKSGFDSFEECFQDQVKNIHALETGLSSDPPMNWRVSSLDKFAITSFSDAHSFWPWRLGREATIFDCDLNYKDIISAIRNKKNISTIDIKADFGKYHFDGHRNCGIVLDPREARKYNNICPKCGRELTIGVLHRVEDLADREEGYRPRNAIGFKILIPLSELISAVFGIEQLYSKGIWQIYTKLIKEFKNEFNVLLNVPLEDLKKIVDEKLAKVIIKNRKGEIKVKPGYDGVYGNLMLEKSEVVHEKEIGEVREKKIRKEKIKPEQKTLGEFNQYS